jgi:hypothetical protein
MLIPCPGWSAAIGILHLQRVAPWPLWGAIGPIAGGWTGNPGYLPTPGGFGSSPFDVRTGGRSAAGAGQIPKLWPETVKYARQSGTGTSGVPAFGGTVTGLGYWAPSPQPGAVATPPIGPLGPLGTKRAAQAGPGIPSPFVSGPGVPGTLISGSSIGTGGAPIGEGSLEGGPRLHYQVTLLPAHY